jgi:DNA-3-methyladenine glycosylase II
MFHTRKIVEHLRKDPIMGAIVERVGPYGIGYREPTFETLVRSIVSQQLSTKVARVIFERLADAVPEVTPENILKLRPTKMRRLGLSGQKTEYIRSLARHARDGSLQFERLPEMDDEAVIQCLTQVKGVGVWTAHMFLIFALQRPDVLAVGDLGVRSAIRKAYGLEELPTPAEVEKMAAAWRPYSSAACWYLWRSLENEAAM